MAVGDIMLGRKVAGRASDAGPEALFCHVKEFLGKSDILIGNLEAPLLDTKEKPDPRVPIPLKAPEEAAKSLRLSRISIMNLANNHIMDYGLRGLNHTVRLLELAGVLHCGAGTDLEEATAPLDVDVKGLRLSFLSFSSSYNADSQSAGTAPLDGNLIQKAVAAQSQVSDFVIVSLHHGVEYSDYPTPSMVKMARQVVEAGASLVLGHHPHVLQGIERYHGGIIAYSLGNFVFDSADPQVRLDAHRGCLLGVKYGVQFPPDDDRPCQSAVLEIRFAKNRPLEYTVHPAMIMQDFAPALLQGKDAERVLMRLEALSSGIGNPDLPENVLLKRLQEDSLKSYLKNNSFRYYLRKMRHLNHHHLKLIPELLRAKFLDKH